MSIMDMSEATFHVEEEQNSAKTIKDLRRLNGSITSKMRVRDWYDKQEELLRSKNVSLQTAWEQYQIVLQLVKDRG